jgi:hypothetical protein
VVAAVLADPGPHLDRVYELTGPQSQDLDGVAREYSDALNPGPTRIPAVIAPCVSRSVSSARVAVAISSSWRRSRARRMSALASAKRAVASSKTASRDLIAPPHFGLR